jgi:hypothetical protein
MASTEARKALTRSMSWGDDILICRRSLVAIFPSGDMAQLTMTRGLIGQKIVPVAFKLVVMRWLFL